MATSHPPRISPIFCRRRRRTKRRINIGVRIAFGEKEPVDASDDPLPSPCFAGAPRRSRLWSAGTCYRFLAYSRMQTSQFAHSDLRYLVSSCSKSSFYFPLFPLLPPVHSLPCLRVGVNRDSIQEPAKHIEQEHPRPSAHVSAVAGSLTDPLACASSFYALARAPYKRAARASGSGVSVLAAPRGEAALECGNLLPLSGLQPPANTPVRAFRSPNSDLRSPTPCVLDVRSSAFSRLAQYRPRQEPRKTRNTRKAERISNRRPQRDRCPCCPARTTRFPSPISED